MENLEFLLNIMKGHTLISKSFELAQHVYCDGQLKNIYNMKFKEFEQSENFRKSILWNAVEIRSFWKLKTSLRIRSIRK